MGRSPASALVPIAYPKRIIFSLYVGRAHPAQGFVLSVLSAPEEPLANRSEVIALQLLENNETDEEDQARG